MITKHLPGSHDQKKHGARGLDDAPSPHAVHNALAQKYGFKKSPTLPVAASGGFEANTIETREEGQYILATEIGNVKDPAEAEEYANDFIRLAKESGYKTVYLRGIPLELAIKHDASYRISPAQAAGLTEDALTLLFNKYELKIPPELVDTNLKTLVHWFEAALRPHLSTADDIGKYIPTALNGAYLIKVKDITSIRHPLYEDVPLYVELLESQPSRSAYIKLK